MSEINNNQRIQNLQFIYAQIDTMTGRCIDVFTSSDEIPFPEEYILIPEFTSAYHGKFYNLVDQKWYLDQNFEFEWEEAPQW